VAAPGPAACPHRNPPCCSPGLYRQSAEQVYRRCYAMRLLGVVSPESAQARRLYHSEVSRRCRVVSVMLHVDVLCICVACKQREHGASSTKFRRRLGTADATRASQYYSQMRKTSCAFDDKHEANDGGVILWTSSRLVRNSARCRQLPIHLLPSVVAATRPV
jgi:hypothetical protein